MPTYIQSTGTLTTPLAIALFTFDTSMFEMPEVFQAKGCIESAPEHLLGQICVTHILSKSCLPKVCEEEEEM